jgi:hypothetical protein
MFFALFEALTELLLVEVFVRVLYIQGKIQMLQFGKWYRAVG